MKRALLFLLALAGCNAGRAFYASSGDYADYRALRVADSYEARMAAAWRYLRERPDGVYRDRVQRYFDRAEPLFYTTRKESRAGLETYLRTLPDGPHSQDALELLGLLRRERSRAELDSQRAEATLARIDAEEALRREAASVPLVWIDLLLDERAWRGPFSEASSELLVPWNVSLPAPACGPWEEGHYLCSKPVARGFRVSSGGERVARSVAFEVELELDPEWRLVRATLRGTSLFVRVLEASERKPLDDRAHQRRAASHFEQLLTQRLLAHDLVCNGGSDADGRVELECERLWLRMTPGSENEIVIEPRAEAAASEPPATPP